MDNSNLLPALGGSAFLVVLGIVAVAAVIVIIAYANRVIADPAHYQQRLQTAAGQRQAGQLDSAWVQYEKTVRGIARVPNPSPELLTLKGRAHLGLGELSDQKAQPDAALTAYRAAAALIDVDEPALSRVATSYAREESTAEPAVRAYLRRFRLHPGDLKSDDEMVRFLRERCMLPADPTPDQTAAVDALAAGIAQADPSVYWAHYARGLCALERNDPAQALESLRTAARLAPQWAAIPFQIGRTLQRAGQPAEALVAYRFSLELDERQPEAYFQVGRLLAARADSEADPAATRDEAAQALANATRLAPKRADLWSWLGQVQRSAGRLSEARSAFGRAADLAPRQTADRMNLADVLIKLGHDAEAVSALQTALDVDAALAEARLTLAGLLLKGGRFPQAERHYRTLLAAAPDHDLARAGLGRSLYHQDQFAEAVGELRLVKTYDRFSLFAFARASDRARAWPRAEGLYRHWIGLFGAEVEVALYFGCVIARQGRYEDALRELRQAETGAESATPYVRGQLALSLGGVLTSLNRLAEAERSLAEAEGLLPTDARVPYARAAVAVQQSQWGLANQLFARSAALDPTFEAAYAGQGLAAEADHRYADACAAYAQSVRCAPHWEAPAARLAVNEVRVGRWVDALARMEKLGRYSRTNEVRFQQGVALAQLGRYEEALSVWKGLEDSAELPVRANRAAAYDRLARSAFDQNRFADAIERWTQSLECLPNPERSEALSEALIRQALAELRTVQTPENPARRLFERAQALAPDDARAAYGLALVHLLDGQGAAASGLLSTVLESAPDDRRARFLKAAAELQEGRVDQARPLLNDLLVEDGAVAPAIAVAVGQAALLSDQPRAALAAYQSLLLAPDDPAQRLARLEPAGGSLDAVEAAPAPEPAALADAPIEPQSTESPRATTDESSSSAPESETVARGAQSRADEAAGPIVRVALDGTGDFADLAQAVAESQPGSELRLKAGRYTLANGLAWSHALALVGEGDAEIETDAGASVLHYHGRGRLMLRGLKIRWTGQSPEVAAAVRVTGGHVAITECSFSGATSTADEPGSGLILTGDVSGEVRRCDAAENGIGITIQSSGDLWIEDNACHDNLVNGLAVHGAGNARIEGNRCYQNKRSGLLVGERATPTLLRNQCRQNEVNGLSYYADTAGTAQENACEENEGSGIFVSDQAHPDLNDNRCARNKVSGLAYDERSSGTARRNHCDQNGVNGVFVDGEAHPLIIENVCSGNRRSGLACFGAGAPRLEQNRSRENAGSGVYCGESTGANLIGNICEENEDAGILCVGHSAPALDANACVNNPVGIRITEQARPVVVNNRCEGNQQDGISFEAQAAGSARHNQCNGNSVSGIAVHGDSQPALEANACQGNTLVGLVFVDRAQATAHGNICENNGQIGILVADQARPSLRENQCLRNQVDGLRYTDNAGGSAHANACHENQHNGIALFDTSAPTLGGNTCRQNGMSGIGYANQSAGRATQNRCEHNDVGILLSNQSAPELVGNTCSQNREDGISLRGESTAEITRNLCEDNLEDGLYIAAKARPTLRDNLCQRNGQHDVADLRQRQIKTAADELLAGRSQAESQTLTRLPLYVMVERSAAMEGDAMVAFDQGLAFLKSELELEPRAAATVWLNVVSFSNYARIEAPLTALVNFQAPPLRAESSRAVSLGAGLQMLQTCMAADLRPTDYQPIVYVFLASPPTDDWRQAAQNLMAARRNELAVTVFSLGARPTAVDWAPLTQVSVPMESLSSGSFGSLLAWREPSSPAGGAKE